mmetsp:Transcript_2797/g.2326  ORF Transcript_2797/g.2326 Transcript_2797/m.2326 type:complete len:105 (+) Transcript_2797:235-549(+)
MTQKKSEFNRLVPLHSFNKCEKFYIHHNLSTDTAKYRLYSHSLMRILCNVTKEFTLHNFNLSKRDLEKIINNYHYLEGIGLKNCVLETKGLEFDVDKKHYIRYF